MIQFADFIRSELTCVILIRISSDMAFFLFPRSRVTSVIHGDCERGSFRIAWVINYSIATRDTIDLAACSIDRWSWSPIPVNWFRSTYRASTNASGRRDNYRALELRCHGRVRTATEKSRERFLPRRVLPRVINFDRNAMRQPGCCCRRWQSWRTNPINMYSGF